ncbi:MAG: type II toxin-antitoxin system RelE/ParE family toxin [Elusimicrobia bacterium]|nr:type II toxin-antitoxin system RelE/ParE family toxin [Elusimicrobiota bacterium]
MDKFTVLLSSQAKKYCEKVDKKTQDLLRDCFLHIEDNPFYHPGGRIKRIHGQNLYRFRIGNLRIIYEINELKKEVPIHLIGPRGDIYKKI